MAKKEHEPDTHTVAFRMDRSEMAALDAEVRRRGDPHTRSSVVRSLVLKGLAVRKGASR